MTRYIVSSSFQSLVSDGSGFFLYCLGLFASLHPKTFKLFVFHIFWLWMYLMKIIPETCRPHQIRYIYLFILHVLVSIHTMLIASYILFFLDPSHFHLPIQKYDPQKGGRARVWEKGGRVRVWGKWEGLRLGITFPFTNPEVWPLKKRKGLGWGNGKG